MMDSQFILVLQLGEEALNYIKQSTNKIVLKKHSFLDKQELLNERIQEARLVFLQWDGEHAPSAKFIRWLSIRKDLEFNKVFILVPSSRKGDLDQLKKHYPFKFLRLPEESFKIPMIIYDFFASEEEKEQERKQQELNTDHNTSLIPGVATPKIITDFNLLARIKQEIEERDNRLNMLVSKYAEKQGVSFEPVIVFHQNMLKANTLAQKFMRSGFVNVYTETEMDEVFAKLSSLPICFIALGYDLESRVHALQFLRVYNYSRRFPVVPIIAYCPGDAAYNDFVKGEARHFIYEAVLNLSELSHLSDRETYFNQTQKILNQSVLSQNWHKLKSFHTPVYELKRRHLEHIVEYLREFTQSICATGRKELAYWNQIELFYVSLLKKDFETVRKVADALCTPCSDDFNVRILYSYVKAKESSIKEAARWLWHEAKQNKQLTEIEFYELACLIIKWKKPDILKDMLLYWHEQPQFTCGHRFYFLMSQYYFLIGQQNEGQNYLSQAVSAQPLCDEYLVALLKFFRSIRQHKRELDFIHWAEHCPWLGRGFCRVYRADVLACLGKKQEALRLLNEVLAEDPENKSAHQLFGKLNQSMAS